MGNNESVPVSATDAVETGTAQQVHNPNVPPQFTSTSSQIAEIAASEDESSLVETSKNAVAAGAADPVPPPRADAETNHTPRLQQQQRWSGYRKRIDSPYPDTAWYDLGNHFWPAWIGAGANCLLGSYVCSTMFESSLLRAKGRVAGAVAISVATAMYTTRWNRRAWRQRKASSDAVVARNLLFTSLVVGPLAGFLGGSAVSQPTHDIRYKGNPGYFATPVVQRYAGRTVCTLIGVSLGGWHCWASWQRVNADLAWEQRQHDVLREKFLAKQKQQSAETR